jgi:hypothetical protein
MVVIGFPCVSLGNSTVQFHDSLDSRRACPGSEASFSGQYGDRAWGVHYREAAVCCAFLWAKWLTAKDIQKEMFLVYIGNYLSLKAVHNWVEECDRYFADDPFVTYLMTLPRTLGSEKEYIRPPLTLYLYCKSSFCHPKHTTHYSKKHIFNYYNVSTQLGVITIRWCKYAHRH